MTELGKTGKHTGALHPRDLRKIDPIPVRVTPKAKPKRRVEKLYGFVYEVKYPWNRKWQRGFSWYKSAPARDQGLAAHNRRTANYDWYRKATPISKESLFTDGPCPDRKSVV